MSTLTQELNKLKKANPDLKNILDQYKEIERYYLQAIALMRTQKVPSSSMISSQVRISLSKPPLVKI